MPGNPDLDQHLCVGSELQTKRQDRKRRSTANPAYSGLFEPEVGLLPVAVRVEVGVREGWGSA